MNDFRESLLRLSPKHWDRVLGALESSVMIGDPVGLDNDDLCTLSAYRGDLVDFASLVKGSSNQK